MMLPLVFSCLLSAWPDTSTICSATCSMSTDPGAGLVVVESRLFNSRNECGVSPQWSTCRKTIMDTLTGEAFAISMWDTQLPDERKRPISEKHLGNNTILFYKPRNRKDILICIKPDNCDCRWVSVFDKGKMAFVEKTLPLLVFRQNR